MSRNYQPYGYGRPFGDIFSVQTPNLDMQGQHLWQEHLLREQQQRQDAMRLDDLMRGEIGKIRSADTPDFINAWEKYKAAKMPLYNPKTQLSPQEINRINQEANVHLGHAMQIANGSAQAKDDAKELIAENKQRPYASSKDFKDRINAYMNTPLSGLANHPQFGDLTDRNGYFSQGNISDLQPIFNKAKGTLRPVGQPTREPLDKFNTKVTSYQGYSSPLEYYQSVIGGLKGEDMQRNFLNNYHFTPEEEQNITDQYNEKVLKNQRYADAYGANNLQFPDWADATPVGRTARLMAMEHALTPLVQTDKKELNEEAKMAATQRDIKERIAYAAQFREGDTKKMAGLVSLIHNAIPNLPTDENGVDVTEMLRGVKVTGLPTGQSFGASKVIYNPKTKQVTYTDVQGNQKTKSFEDFRKDISTINTAQDLNVVDALGKSTEAKTKTATPTAAPTGTYLINGKHWTKQQVEKAASASGRTIDEYITDLKNKK